MLTSFYFSSLCWVYSTNPSKMISNSPEVFELQLVVFQTQPVQLQLAASSPHALSGPDYFLE